MHHDAKSCTAINSIANSAVRSLSSKDDSYSVRSRKPPSFTDHEGSSPCSQAPAICPYPQSAQSSPLYVRLKPAL